MPEIFLNSLFIFTKTSIICTIFFLFLLKTPPSKAGKLKQKFWIENYRWIVLILLLVIGVFLLGFYYQQVSNHDQDAAKNISLISAPEVVLDTKETQTIEDPEMKEAPKVFANTDNPQSV